MKIIFSCWETLCKCTTFPRCLTTQLQTLCPFRMNFAHEHHLCKLCSTEGRIVPIHDWGTSRSVINDLQCLQGEQWWEANCPWEGPFSEMETHPGRTEMPNMREVVPDTPKDPSRSAVLLTLLTGWATVRTSQSARGTWQSKVPEAHNVS